MKRTSSVQMVLLFTVLAIGCSELSSMQSVRSSIQQRYGWDDVTVEVDVAVGEKDSDDRRVVHVRVGDEVEATGSRVAEEVAELTSTTLSLGEGDSIVVSFESEARSGAARQARAETYGFAGE